LNFFLPSLPLRDVIARFQDGHRSRLLISAQRVSSGHHHCGALGCRPLELALPAPGPKQLGVNVLEWRWKHCLQELVGMLSERVFGRPPVQLLRAKVPVRDDEIHITDENRVMCKIEQADLLRSLRKKLSLDAASNRAEPAD
jgi:hypothetical protein